MKKIKAAAAITAVVLAAIAVVSGPVIIADISIPDGNDGYVGTVTVYLNATDDISGVKYIEYRVDRMENGLLIPGEPQQHEGDQVIFDCFLPGDYTIYYFSVDNVGNREAEKTTTFTILPDDVTPPETTCELEGRII